MIISFSATFTVDKKDDNGAAAAAADDDNDNLG